MPTTSELVLSPECNKREAKCNAYLPNTFLTFDKPMDFFRYCRLLTFDRFTQMKLCVLFIIF